MVMRVAYVLLIAALAVVGIAMSAHGSTLAPHTTASTPPMISSVAHAPHDDVSSAAPHVDSEGSALPEALCADCQEDHAGLAVACAFLALIVVVGVLVPLLAMRFGVAAPGVSLHGHAPRGMAEPRPPDLAELCISRQ